MSGENAEVVARLYDAANRGGDAEVRRLMTPDAVFDWSRRKLDPLVAQGPDDVGQTWADLTASFESMTMHVDELIEVGDEVLALVRVVAAGKASGAVVDASVAHLWTIRDGAVARMTYYGDRAEALAAVGVER